MPNPDYSNTPASALRPSYGYAPAELSPPPIVSLITPFFDGGSLFHETAESVFRQSLQQWEWIIVDDCSADPESVRILDTFVSKDPRIRVMRSVHRGGPAAARNLGVSAAKAPYVAFIDADDLLEPTALEKWLWFLECHPQYGMVKGFQAGFGASEYIWRGGFISGDAMLERNLIQTASMMRREVYQAVGGMDETIRGGMEDWDFWLRCADAGHWGWTLPEVLDWYRRRASHNDRWEDWDSSSRESAFRDELRRRYPRLFNGGFPRPEESYPSPYSPIAAPPVFENRLSRKPGVERLLLVVPHLALGGADQCNLDVISELTTKHSFEITVVATLASEHEWRSRFEALTPDVFTLDTFLELQDYPRFLAYLIRSRQMDAVLISHSHLGYQLLPFLRSECPSVRCFDYVHIEEPEWKSGGYPAYSLSYKNFLDRTVTSTQHLKEWMTAQGSESDRISVVTTNIDLEHWTRSNFDADGLRMKWKAPEGTPVLLFAARLCRQKQPDVLAETLRQLHNRRIRFHCFVVGDGEDAAWLRASVAKNGLTEVCFLGNRSIEELRELFAISDIFFLPSRQEGIAVTLYEAMAMEAVVVAANVGGQRELVTPECGFLIEPDENQSTRYTDALASLLEDGDKRRAMATAARKRVADHFRLDDMGRRMAQILASRETPPFDMGQAWRGFAAVLTREIMEQGRLEMVVAQNRNQDIGGTTEAIRILPKANAKTTILLSLAVLRALFPGSAHRLNRRLLFQTLSQSKSRREILAAFDRRFYCSSNPDVPSFGPLPLLHYVFFGFEENRRPSPAFDRDTLFRTVSKTPLEGVNPLLWKCVWGRATKPVEESNTTPAADLRDDFIARVVRNRSFADVGGLWGTVNEKVSVAARAHAATLAMIDISPQDSELWRKFDERTSALDVQRCERISSDICVLATSPSAPKFDVVHCSGVLYHHPNPISLLQALRQITGQYLILTSAVTQQHISNDLGSYDAPPSGVIFVPALSQQEREVLWKYWRENAGVGACYGISEAVKWDAEDFAPWWWLPTPTAMLALAECVGFRVIESGDTWNGNAHTALLQVAES